MEALSSSIAERLLVSEGLWSMELVIVGLH